MSNPPDFTTAFEGLRTAVTRANELQEGFYQSLPGTLGEINRDLQGITEQIEGIIAQLKEKDGLVARNQAEINALTEQSDATNAELTTLRESESRNQTEIERLTASVSQLEESRLRQTEKFQAEKDKLIKDLDETLQNERAADAANNNTLKKQLEEREATIRGKLASLNELKKESDAKYEENIAQLEAQEEFTKQKAADLNARIAAKETESSDLSTRLTSLETENDSLKEQIRDASALMSQATTLLSNLDPENEQKINEQITALRVSIGEINRILDSGPTSKREILHKIFQENRGTNIDPSLVFNNISNIPINQPINIGRTGKSKPLNEILGTIIGSQYDEDVKVSLLLQINAAKDVKSIQAIVNEAITNGLRLSGGRKTRKHKKHGRKTKRKQRGGFHYSERAHRRRITTSSSSRRSSRRSSSRRSSRR